jgi:glycosyltransferase involved in cell wall biosynthesis
VAADGAGPLVSIGIPTYQRLNTLRRSVESALAQTHSRLELVISDDGSDDGTEDFCREVEARDPRVRYLRSGGNRGSTDSFNELFSACRGEYVMMLADDDWIERDYVGQCLEALRTRRGAALVAGWPRYVRNGDYVCDGVIHNHVGPTPEDRVLEYLREVDDNGIMYGLMPREVLREASPLPNVLGNDWLLVARIACRGSIHTLPEVRVNRELGGTSVTVGSIVRTFGLAGWQARVPQLVIAWQVLRDIAIAHPVYRPLGLRRRWRLGLYGALASIRWRALAWHLLTPSLERLGRRPRGRPVWALYDRVTRALGAGRRP